MLRFVTLVAAVTLAAAAPNPENLFKIDISPEEAQRYLENPPFSEPQLSGRTAVLPLVRYNDPRFRAAEAGPTLGHYWKNGKEIENTEDYVEEVYNAAQYHGQDGLGGYGYGYETPESAKVEKRVSTGNVAGSYTYKTPDSNELIKVRYWADSQGFHQEDNIPKVELKPVEEAPDVREARLAHEKAWQEAAAAASQNPDPQGAYNPARYEYQPQASETQSVVAPAPTDDSAREGKAYSAQGYNQPQGSFNQPQGGFNQGSYSQTQGRYTQGQGAYNQPQGQYQGLTGTEKYEEPEPTGPPRGFFYSYTYPVSVLVAKSDAQSGSINSGYPIDKDTVSVGELRG